MRRSFLLAAAILALLTASALVVLAGGESGAGTDDSAAVSAAVPGPHPAPTHTPSQRVVRSVVGLGDSVPAGTACSCTSYVTLVAQRLAAAEHLSVSADNLAQPGATTSSLMAQLSAPATAAELARADLVIVTVGANDLEGDGSCTPTGSRGCYSDALRGFQSLYPRMMARLRQLVTRAGARIVVTGYWNVFLDGVVARQQGGDYVANSVALTQAVNQVVASTAAATAAIYVDLYTPFKGGDGDHDDTSLLAADGDHPNAAGHRLIANAITKLVTG